MRQSSNRIIASALVTQIAVIAMALVPSVSGASEPVVLYIAPDGADNADGKSSAHPLASIQGALNKASQILSNAKSVVEIRVGAGRYTGQRATFAGAAEGEIISMLPATPGSRPVFDGGGTGGTWLVLKPTAKGQGHLSITGLEITNYITAISLNGSRDIQDLAVNDIGISNNIFRRIGQIADPKDAPSSAAVRLINGDHTRIEDNKFIDIRNIQKCGLLHSIYVAHGSTYNLIKGNTFENGCGDAIRFRDGSGENSVIGNKFVDSWAIAPISDWYCDSSGREDCTKKTPECPSYGNLLRENSYVVRSAKPPESASKKFGADETKLCAAQPGKQRFVDK